MEHNSGKENLYYTYTDYQGNLIEVTDASGKVKESYAYDPWGLRKDPTNWSLTDTRTSFLFSRGYTMHEHLDDFGLINMNSCVKRGQCANLFAAMPSVARVGEANGRVYDPLMAQFLSPDPYIQAPGSWMNYNRYAYCLNNPLMYSDPSGYNWFKDAWNWAWGKLNQFAIWADKNGIPPGGFGVGIQGDTPYYNANLAGLTYDTRYHNQFDPGINVNRNINELRLAEGVVNYNPGGGTPWYSIYNWPGLGSSAQTMDALYAGDYLSATGHFLTCAAEVFTMGYASTVSFGAKTTVVAAKTSTSFADDAIRLTTSSKSIAPSRTYTIFDGSGQLYKFGVTDANLARYGQSLGQAGPGAYGKFSSIMPKNQAHIMEKYLRSLHYNSTGQYALPGMKIPYPVNFNTGLPIKP